MICLKYPFQGKDFDDLKLKILNEPFQPIRTLNSRVSNELIDLCNKMLSKDAKDRPSTTEIFNLKFI